MAKKKATKKSPKRTAKNLQARSVKGSGAERVRGGAALAAKPSTQPAWKLNEWRRRPERARAGPSAEGLRASRWMRACPEPRGAASAPAAQSARYTSVSNRANRSIAVVS
jgi:hypothetical protein